MSRASSRSPLSSTAYRSSEANRAAANSSKLISPPVGASRPVPLRLRTRTPPDLLHERPAAATPARAERELLGESPVETDGGQPDGRGHGHAPDPGDQDRRAERGEHDENTRPGPGGDGIEGADLEERDRPVQDDVAH